MQGRRGDRLLLLHVGQAGDEDDADENRHQQSGKPLQKILGAGGQAADHERHAHVLGAAERDDGAEADQPEEQDFRQLVGPDQRVVQHVAPDHAGEQDADFDHDQEGGTNLRGEAGPSVQFAEGSGRYLPQTEHVLGYARGPVYFSSADQSGAPNLACHWS